MLGGAKVFHTSGVGVGEAGAVAFCCTGKASGVGVCAPRAQPVRMKTAVSAVSRHFAQPEYRDIKVRGALIASMPNYGVVSLRLFSDYSMESRPSRVNQHSSLSLRSFPEVSTS